LVAATAGCRGPQETTRTEILDELPSPDLQSAEESFNPSDYDRMPGTQKKDSTGGSATSGETSGPSPALPAPDLAPGYRVQLISTTSIDEAKAKKAYAESLFPFEWFYLQYDPPTYKIRAGNFLIRFDADRFRSQATERGFVGAWVVPERVFKNPPPPPSHETPPRPK
jgi:hypothetical protein